jgi:hypothetical protein
MKKNKLDIVGIISLSILFILLTVAGYISYKNIDWTVLERIESQQLILPTPIPTK